MNKNKEEEFTPKIDENHKNTTEEIGSRIGESDVNKNITPVQNGTEEKITSEIDKMHDNKTESAQSVIIEAIG